MDFDKNLNKKFENHPCFNSESRHRTARIHLPTADKCNIQCKFCNRKYDCVNESRPGVTSVVLKPLQALSYLDSVTKTLNNIAVAGIAGPGDPFACPDETLQTLELVRRKYPDMMLCLATNGLELAGYVEQIAQLQVSHVTITLNAVEPVIGAKIYSWVRYKNRVYRGIEGASVLLERQREAVRLLKERRIVVKINTVIIPGINDEHAVAVAETCEKLGVDVQNCIPLMHVEGTELDGHKLPEQSEMLALREKAGKYVTQMSHCARCRADAAGIVGQSNTADIEKLLKEAAVVRTTQERPYIAVATMEGLFVNRHLGEAPSLWIFGKKEEKIVLLEQRSTPVPGSGDDRWRQLARSFRDCAAVLVSSCGSKPQKILETDGLHVIAMEGLLADSLPYIFSGRELPPILLRTAGRCGSGRSCGSGAGRDCGGNGEGC
ncbi:MAG: nitrogenase cofactor biosynthesis protein NifB [Planctomycetaceae bacterium]|jgi:nitrogen fixation protein NifB|nr:nitrogenase cofactor biosynthesis protein NifB [Planctomycetaceae bacterium]